MIAHPHTFRFRRGHRRCPGASLIAWIAVVAVLAILAALLLPALLRQIDFQVARRETAELARFGEALKRAVTRHGYIPGHENWAQFVAAEAGCNPGSVAVNPRHRPRLLLIDTNGWFNGQSLPYAQPAMGTSLLPLNARVMIVSSLGAALPLTPGRIDAAEFDILWRAVEGTASFPSTGFWSGWDGRRDDVKIERVNLSTLFITLYVGTYHTEPAQGHYSIGTNAPPVPAPLDSLQTPAAPRYYLRGTLLSLFTPTDVLEAKHILNRDGSFMFQNGIWKSSGAGGNMPAGIDIAGVVTTFLNAIPNTRARYGPEQQRLVVESMMTYMSNYNAWAEGGFTDADLKAYLVNIVQPRMITTAQQLFQGAYYPTNASGPL